MLFIPLALGFGYKATKFLAVWGPRVYMAGSLYFTLSGTKKELSEYFELRVGSASYDLEALISRKEKGPENLPFADIRGQGPCTLNENGQLVGKNNVIIAVNQTQYFFDGKNIFLAVKKDKAEAAKFIKMSVSKDNLERIESLKNNEQLKDEDQEYIDNLFMETEEKARQYELEEVIANYPAQWQRVIKELQIAMDKIYKGKDYTLWEDLENTLGNIWNEDTSEYMRCLGYMIKMHHIGEQYTLLKNTASPHSDFVAGGTIAENGQELEDYEKGEWYRTGDLTKLVQHRDSLNDNLKKLKAIEQEYNTRKAITLNSQNEKEKFNINPKDTKEDIERKIKLRMKKDFPKPSFWETVRGFFSFILGPTPYMQVHKLLFKGLVEENLGKIVTTESELEGKIQTEKARIEKEIVLTEKKIALVDEVQEKIMAEKNAIQEKTVQLNKNIEALKELKEQLNIQKNEVQGQAAKQKERVERVKQHIEEVIDLQKKNGSAVVTAENISTPKETSDIINGLNANFQDLIAAVSIGGLEKEIEAVYKNAAFIMPIEGAQMLSSATEVVADLVPDFAAEILDILTTPVTALQLEITEEDGNKGASRLAELKKGKEYLGKKELEIVSLENNLNAFEMDLGLYQDKLENAEKGVAEYEEKGLKIVETTIPVLMQNIFKKISESKDIFAEAKKEAEENAFFNKEKLQQLFTNRDDFFEKMQSDGNFDENNTFFNSFLEIKSTYYDEDKDWKLQLEDKMQELTTQKVTSAVQKIQNKIYEGLKSIEDLQNIMAKKEDSYQNKFEAFWGTIIKLEAVLTDIDGLMVEVQQATHEARENKKQAEKIRNAIEKWAVEAEENKKKARKAQQQESASRIGLSLTRAEKAKDYIKNNIDFLENKSIGQTALEEANSAIKNITECLNISTPTVEDSAEEEAKKAEAAAKTVINAVATKKVKQAQEDKEAIKQIVENVQAAQIFAQETSLAIGAASTDFVNATQINKQKIAVIVTSCQKELNSAETNCLAAESISGKIKNSTIQESYTHLDNIKQSSETVNASLKEAQGQKEQVQRVKEQFEKLRTELQHEIADSNKNTGAVSRRHLRGIRSDDLKAVKESVLEKIEESREMFNRGSDLLEQFAREEIGAAGMAVDLSKALLQKIEISSETLAHLHQDIQEAVDAGNFQQVQCIHETAIVSQKCNKEQYDLMLAAILIETAHKMLHAKAEIAGIVSTYQKGEQNEEKREKALAEIAAQEEKIANSRYIATELQKLNEKARSVTLSQLMSNNVPALLVEHEGQRLYGKKFDLLLVNLQELTFDVEILKLGLNSDEDRVHALSEKKKLREKREYDPTQEKELAHNLRIAALLTHIIGFDTDNLDGDNILDSISSTVESIFGTSKKSEEALALFPWLKNCVNQSAASATVDFMIELLTKIDAFKEGYPGNEAASRWKNEAWKILHTLLDLPILSKKVDRINIGIYKSHFQEIDGLFNELRQSQAGDMAAKLKLLQDKISTFDDRLATIEPADIAEAFYGANGLQWPFSSKAPTAAEVIQDIIKQAKPNNPLHLEASYKLCSHLRLEMRVYIQQPNIQQKEHFKEWLFESWQALVQARDESVGKAVDEDFIQEAVNANIHKAIQNFCKIEGLALSFSEGGVTPAGIMKCFMEQATLGEKKPHEVHKQYKELRKVVKKLRDEDPDNKMYYEKWLRASRLVELGECRDKGLGMFGRPASIPSIQMNMSATVIQPGGVTRRKLGNSQTGQS